ncbi:hypothetical protein [Nocardia gamkensis]|uniref:hypothetical protein n=1 Tax=Nocardia gamkensis TaxID=352869 RepID=UPI000A79CB77|nr:hypothetical protein [Nocardia gamkensis]
MPDELYALAAEHYDDKALATLAMAIGQVNFFVPLPSSDSRCPAGPKPSSGLPYRPDSPDIGCGRGANIARARNRLPTRSRTATRIRRP